MTNLETQKPIRLLKDTQKGFSKSYNKGLQIPRPSTACMSTRTNSTQRETALKPQFISTKLIAIGSRKECAKLTVNLNMSDSQISQKTVDTSSDSILDTTPTVEEQVMRDYGVSILQ